MAIIPESHRDLLDAPWASLATVARGGSPQVSFVAFLAENGVVGISLNTARAKTAHLIRNPAVGVLIPDPAQPLRYLEIFGDAEVTPDADEAFACVPASSTARTSPVTTSRGKSRVVVTIHPTRVYAADMSH